MKRASITKRTLKDKNGDVTGIRWRARFWSPEGREVTAVFKTKREAQAWIDTQVAAKVGGAFIDPRDGRVTLSTYARDWRSRQVHRPSTGEQYRIWIEKWINPLPLGRMALMDIRPSHVQAWVASQVEHLAPRTIHRHHGMLAGLINDAVRDRVILSNPCIGTRLPEIPDRRIIIPTDAAVVEIHEAIAPHMRAMVHLAAATGMRQGELLGLTVDRQLLAAKGGPRFGPTKSKKSNRTLPVPEDLITTLAAHLEAYGPGPDGVIFTNTSGREFARKSSVNDHLKSALKKVEDAPEGMTWHWFRHYYASRLIRFGESVKTVQARLGHATAAETLDTYGHLWGDSEDRTRVAITGILSGGTPVGLSAVEGE